ncbi:hypothetical protein F2Q69_00008583 [Brassica cretica]|uniref:Uncharacterized protein n=1 Tax=Brassica cretica TaxID=69181 RepID=A0A8S9NYB1_BRACR|nr:hypothetical protein F2Q69_00008583 [Brassica cretica]
MCTHPSSHISFYQVHFNPLKEPVISILAVDCTVACCVSDDGAAMLYRDYEEFKVKIMCSWDTVEFVIQNGNELPRLVTHVYLFLKIRVSAVLSNDPYLLNINMKGLDGIQGPIYVGTGCVFSRQALREPKVTSTQIHAVENIREGVIVADWVALGYRRYLYHGWRSVYCMPKRPAFKGSAPINLSDRLHQVLLLRWALASVEIFLSRHLFALFQGLLKVLASWS